MMMNQGISLGHYILASGIQVETPKITIIEQLNIPQNQIDVKSFLGHVGYHRRFIKDFRMIVAPLNNSIHPKRKEMSRVSWGMLDTIEDSLST